MPKATGDIKEIFKEHIILAFGFKNFKIVEKTIMNGKSNVELVIIISQQSDVVRLQDMEGMCDL